MKEILPELEAWQGRGENIAVATVIQTWGSSPRAAGAKMAINQKGEMIGSVSGGCVEGAVIEEARQVLKTGRPKLLHFGVVDETAWEVGLACGGTIEIFVERFSPLKYAINQDQAVTLATIVRGPDDLLGSKAVIPVRGEPVGPLLETAWRDQILGDAYDLLQQRASTIRHYAAIPPGPPKGEMAFQQRASTVGRYAASLPSGEEESQEGVDVFFDVHQPAPRLIIVGGVHIAIQVIHFAKLLGFCTYLVDPRTAFATPERFPHVDHIVHKWPDEALSEIGLTSETSVVVVTHDPKLDDPALMMALPSPARYVGALGSSRTHAKRIKRLRAEGLAPEHLNRLHAPIGLNIGGRTPAEIALSIVAEIVATRNNMPLTEKPKFFPEDKQ